MLLTITDKNIRVYQCDICGDSFHWDESKGYWFGNYLTPENNIYMCSIKCKQQHEKTNP